MKHIRQRLFTPGPTPIPEQVMQPMTESIIHHRGEEFAEIFKRISDDLKYLFQTEHDVLTLTASGTGAMEAAVANLLSKSDRVLTVDAGKFGSRWADICHAYGVEPLTIKKQWGKAIQSLEIVDVLKKYPDIKAVFVTHNETSTGVTINLKAIANAIRSHSEGLIIVDCISSIGAIPLKMDDWKLDVVLTGSQKGLMLPPGLAFIALNDRAWASVEQSDLPKFYFSLKAARQALDNFMTPYTPATTIIRGLEAALKLIKEKTLERLWFEHQIFGDAVRAGVKALDLKLLAQSPSNSLTAVLVPNTLSCREIIRFMKSHFGITICAGQGHLKHKIFRIGHLGYYDASDIISVISALELTLIKLGWSSEAGIGVRAAQAVLQQL